MTSNNKRIKLEIKHSELNKFRDEIKKITIVNENEIQETNFKESNDPLVVNKEHSDIKEYIRDQIRQSEQRVQKRLDFIEHKLNILLERIDSDKQYGLSILSENDNEDKILEEFVEEDSVVIQDEFNSQIFPIADEETFDWFLTQLSDENYREILTSHRWHLTKNCGTRSFNVSVKDFIRMHFELAVCIKYSVSGYGSRGTKKKKFDSQSLIKYVYECFNKSQPGVHSYQEVSKAIINYWGRSPDTYAKSGESNKKPT
ncbi:hypothetical protein PVAND_007116 [Polypedilum vanderplanki]|uniref:DUF4806 domain-containing protein n=1 Tax=Polypedilum vanderplanki TaxID=319348 RepID=A0A9J6C683_POLVA|nr:hypothetical protein PVAND_007116 [Polypedilum vanderplanki]